MKIKIKIKRAVLYESGTGRQTESASEITGDVQREG
jgi:hypothetical protein